MKIFRQPLEFEWNSGNMDKNVKHKVTNQETEEVFSDPLKAVYKDKLHSEVEERYIVVGKTKQNRLLYVVFTLRDNKVRIISARNLNRKEVQLYEKAA